MRKLLNAFSLNMVEPGSTITTRELDLESVQFMAAPHRCGFDSCVGHADTARILSKMIGQEIKVVRKTVSIVAGESAVVAQYIGPRLSEGATELPEGATIKFILCTVQGASVETDEPLDGSVYGGLMRRARKIAETIHQGSARPMIDGHGNFFAEVTGIGFRAEIFDE